MRLLWILTSMALVSPGCKGLKDEYVVVAELGKDRGGKVGAVNPAVLRHVLMSPDAPLRNYYELGLTVGADDGFRAIRRDAEALAKGEQPGSEHYLQAGVNRLVPMIQKVLLDRDTKPIGTARVRCCRAIDPWTKTFSYSANIVGSKGARDRLVLDIVLNEDAQFIRVDWFDRNTTRQLSWDLSQLRGAFDASAVITPEEVARSIRALHPVQRWYD